MTNARIRWTAACLVLAALAVWIATLVVPGDGDGGASAEPGVVYYDEGTLRYSFHVTTGTEGLYDRSDGADPLTNLAGERPEQARRLRKLLEKALQVDSLEELRGPHRDTIERLKALGYL